MKKVLFAMAVAGMFGFVACNNNKAEEPAQDTTVMECVAEEVVDTNAVEAAVEEVVEAAAETVAQ